MRIEAKNAKGVLVNADTGQPIRFARWAEIPDDPRQPGEFEAFRMDPNIAKARGIPLQSLLYRGRCRLQFMPAQLVSDKPTGRRAPSTPLDEIRREVLRGGEVKVKPVVWLPGVTPPECMEPLCHRAAEWAVSIEQLVEPEKDANGKSWERAVMVDAEFWCSWHFRPPRQISQRGVEVELENIGARPQ